MTEPSDETPSEDIAPTGSSGAKIFGIVISLAGAGILIVNGLATMGGGGNTVFTFVGVGLAAVGLLIRRVGS